MGKTEPGEQPEYLKEKCKPYLWKKGQSGNPKGRPKKGVTFKKEVQMRIENAARLQLVPDAKRLLVSHGSEITLEILEIALRKEPKPTQAKIKCLLACFERIIPSLKVVELKEDPLGRKPAEMTDVEIVELMERMVNMAQNTTSNLPMLETLDG